MQIFNMEMYFMQVRNLLSYSAVHNQLTAAGKLCLVCICFNSK